MAQNSLFYWLILNLSFWERKGQFSLKNILLISRPHSSRRPHIQEYFGSTNLPWFKKGKKDTKLGRKARGVRSRKHWEWETECDEITYEILRKLIKIAYYYICLFLQSEFNVCLGLSEKSCNWGWRMHASFIWVIMKLSIPCFQYYYW